MTDLLSWLRSALDEHERLARSVDAGPRWSAWIPTDGPAVRIGEEVAWSREIDYAVWRCEDEQDGCPEIARAWKGRTACSWCDINSGPWPVS